MIEPARRVRTPIHWAIDDPAVHDRLVDFKLVVKDINTRLGYLILIEEKRRKAEEKERYEFIEIL